MPTVTVNGVSLFYVEQGEGEPVLLVHGGLGDFRDWGGLLSACPARYRAIAYSRRNAYPNALMPEAVTSGFAEHANDLAELVAALGAAPAHVVADSYGAAVALVCALRRPEIVRTLVLDEPPIPSLLGKDPDDRSLAIDFTSFLRQRVLRAFGEGDPEQAVRSLVNRLEGSDGAWDRIPRPARDEILGNATSLYRELRAGFPELTREELHQLRVPVLLLRGDRGPDILHRCTQALADCIPRSRLMTLPGLTHGALPQSTGYARAVLEFLDEHQAHRS